MSDRKSRCCGFKFLRSQIRISLHTQINITDVRFEVLVAVSITIIAFFDLTPYSLEECFGVTYYPHLQGRRYEHIYQNHVDGRSLFEFIEPYNCKTGDKGN